jgi:hypothetical protein
VGDAARFNAPSGLAAGTSATHFTADPANPPRRAGRPAQPVAIITQPRGLTVQPGDPVEFTVTATGWPQPLAYQWYRNGDLIPDATGDTLKLGPAQEAGDGDTYTVVVTNPLGSVTSIGACLTVAKRIHPPSSSSAGGGGAPGIPLLLALALLLALKPPPSRRSRRRFS